MRKNIEKVLRAFLAGKPAKGDSKGTCATDGRTLMSYAMPIAYRFDPVEGTHGADTYLLVHRAEGPSMTTRMQISACESMMPARLTTRVGAAVMREAARSEATCALVYVNYSGEGPGGMYTFDGNATAIALMRRLFPTATWLGDSMCAEQRYAVAVAMTLRENGSRLRRAGDGKTLNVSPAGFTVDADAVAS